MQKRCLIIILTLFISIASYSNYHIFHLGRSEGLTSSAVNCIVQDSTGFMWIGTNNGLYRYDGSHFRHYPIPTSKSQSAIYDDRQILSIAIDHHNKIWLSTFHKLFQFDIEKELFTSYVNSDNLDGITRLHVDHNGHIWALGYQGITMIDVTSQKATVPKGSEGLIASDVFESASNELWFTCLDGNLYKYNYHTHQFHSIPILDPSALSQNTTMVSATECERGTIAIATNNSGIYIFRPERPNQLEPLILEGKSIPPSIHTLMYANNGKLYIGTEQGIYIHDFRQKQTHHLKKSHSILPTLSDNAVHSLYIDKNKQVWAGTFFGGIDVICEESSPLTVLYPTAVDGQKIANIVRSIISDNNGHIWVGTEDNGLFTYNPETHQFNSFQPPNISSPFPSNIQGMSCVGNKLLIGTFNRGLFIIDTSTFQQTHHLDRLSSATGVVTEIITYIEPLSMEEALIGTSNGLYVYHLQNSSIFHITAFPLAFVHCIHQDVNHHIWIGTINDGLYEMKKDGDNWVVIKKNIPYQTVNCIHSFDDGCLFIGTEGSGVFSYDPSSDQCTPIQLSPKPVSQSICNMITDESNHL